MEEKIQRTDFDGSIIKENIMDGTVVQKDVQENNSYRRKYRELIVDG